jgi:hypothetical protein
MPHGAKAQELYECMTPIICQSMHCTNPSCTVLDCILAVLLCSSKSDPASGAPSAVHCEHALTDSWILKAHSGLIINLLCAVSVCAVLMCSPAFEQAKAQENYEHMVSQQAGQQKGRRFAAANEFQQQVQQQRAREEEEAHKKRVCCELGASAI